MFFFFVFCHVCLCRNCALIVNGSGRFIDYRHFADAQIVRHVLVQNGMHEKDIVFLTRGLLSNNPRSRFPKDIYLGTKERLPLHSVESVSLDHYYLLNAIQLRHNELYDLDENDNIFIFISCHGRDCFIKMCERYFVFRDDFMNALISTAKRVGKLLLILDTCDGASLIDSERIPSNACFVVTSGASEASHSLPRDKELGLTPANLFAYRFLHAKFDPNELLSDFLKREIKGKIKSNLIIYGNRTFHLSDFFFPDCSEERLIHKFVL